MFSCGPFGGNTRVLEVDSVMEVIVVLIIVDWHKDFIPDCTFDDPF